MKVAFLFDDDTLAQRLQDHLLYQEHFTIYQDPEVLMNDLEKESYETIVLSDRYFQFSTMCEYIEQMKERKQSIQLIVMLSNQHHSKKNEQYMKYCLSQKIQYIHPGQSISSITEKIFHFLFGEENPVLEDRQNIVLFLGSTPNIGTTVVSFSTAIQMAKQTDQTIGYICLNLKSSKIHRYLGLDQPVISLDSIRAEMKSKSLNRDRLLQYSYFPKEIPNLHVIFGNLIREQAEFYTVEDLHYFLHECSNAFDLCIVEVSAYWDNAATICGLLHADTKIIISTDHLTHFQEDVHRWIKSISPIFDIDFHSFDLFITQRMRGSSNNGFRMKDIRKETGMNIVGKMGRYDFVDELLNQGKIVELALQSKDIVDECSGLVKMLMSLYHIQKKQDKKQKSWIYRWIGGHA